MASVQRKLTFVAWADMSPRKPFNFQAAAKKLAKIKPSESILAHGRDDVDMTAIDHLKAPAAVKPGEPLALQLLALHDAANAPSEWGPGHGTRTVQIGKDRYTAFITHVLIWPDKVAAFDAHRNAPGLGRLSDYIRRKTGERVIFRALYEQGLQEQLKDIDGYRSFEFGIYDPHKRAALGDGKMLQSLLPKRYENVPSLSVKMGMSKRGPRDAYLDDEIVDEFLAVADSAEDFLDALKLRGRSKTIKTPSGKPAIVEIDLLHRRLTSDASIQRAGGGSNLPDAGAAFKALRKARQQLDKDKKIERAQEARLLVLDGN